MTTYELLRENEWTVDGRKIVPPVLWKDTIIPLMSRGEGSRILGKVTNLRRDGNKVLGDTDVELPEGTALTCDVDYASEHMVTLDDGRIEMTNVRLRGAYVNTQDNYPWKDDE